MAARHFVVKLKRSACGRPETQRKTLESLGLTRFGKVAYLEDTPAVRGMLFKMVHVVDVEPRDGACPKSKKRAKRVHKGSPAKSA
jgi:large subunit ribosomal protein L30